MALSIAHWVAHNGSGMYHVAETLHAAEVKLGLDSHLINIDQPVEWEKYVDVDIHVPHTNFPLGIRKLVKNPKKVMLSHGTPEHIFNMSLQEGKLGYGHGDHLMIWMHDMQTSDAVCTFWPRHQWIMQQMCDKRTEVKLIPLGIDRDFWAKGKTHGKYTGNPSVLSCENGHIIKWPLDLFTMWPMIYDQIPEACLHVNYMPQDQHRWWFPLVNRNGASYGAHLSALKYVQSELRHVLASVDYYCNLVKYGDFNRIGLEASCVGTQIISYHGNPYADFWIHEGDQRLQAEELLGILRGETKPREDKEEIHTHLEMAQAMIGIYEEVLDRGIKPIKVPKSMKVETNGNGKKEVVLAPIYK